MPGSLNTVQLDPELSAPIVRATARRPVQKAMTNSFGFGGSNCALILGQPT